MRDKIIIICVTLFMIEMIFFCITIINFIKQEYGTTIIFAILTVLTWRLYRKVSE